MTTANASYTVKRTVPFLGQDPVEGGSANDYDYVNGDPLNRTDISGKCGECWAMAALYELFAFLASQHLTPKTFNGVIPYIQRVPVSWQIASRRAFSGSVSSLRGLQRQGPKTYYQPPPPPHAASHETGVVTFLKKTWNWAITRGCAVNVLAFVYDAGSAASFGAGAIATTETGVVPVALGTAAVISGGFAVDDAVKFRSDCM